jgi:hypothetical protein
MVMSAFLSKVDMCGATTNAKSGQGKTGNLIDRNQKMRATEPLPDRLMRRHPNFLIYLLGVLTPAFVHVG